MVPQYIPSPGLDSNLPQFRLDFGNVELDSSVLSALDEINPYKHSVWIVELCDFPSFKKNYDWFVQ